MRVAVSLAAILVGAASAGVRAGPEVYCDAYARDVASRKTGQGAEIITGTIDPASADDKWRASYDKVLAECMETYAPEAVTAGAEEAIAEEAVAESAPAKKSGKPKPGTKAWIDYCEAHYRSFDADTGKYKSYSGTWRVCR